MSINGRGRSNHRHLGYGGLRAFKHIDKANLLEKHYKETYNFRVTNSYSPLLTDEEQKIAYALWQSLVMAPSTQHLNEARQNLGQAPLDVRRAVLHSITFTCKQNQEPTPDQNPFVPKDIFRSPMS